MFPKRNTSFVPVNPSEYRLETTMDRVSSYDHPHGHRLKERWRTGCFRLVLLLELKLRWPRVPKHHKTIVSVSTLFVIKYRKNHLDPSWGDIGGHHPTDPGFQERDFYDCLYPSLMRSLVTLVFRWDARMWKWVRLNHNLKIWQSVWVSIFYDRVTKINTLFISKKYRWPESINKKTFYG